MVFFTQPQLCNKILTEKLSCGTVEWLINPKFNFFTKKNLTSKFCSVANDSASNLQLIFVKRSSRIIELTSMRFFMLICNSSSGCKYSGALPAFTSANLFSICVTLSRYSLRLTNKHNFLINLYVHILFLKQQRIC